jgi:ABC-type Fe3+ transport system permease subunit
MYPYFNDWYYLYGGAIMDFYTVLTILTTLFTIIIVISMLVGTTWLILEHRNSYFSDRSWKILVFSMVIGGSGYMLTIITGLTAIILGVR